MGCGGSKGEAAGGGGGGDSGAKGGKKDGKKEDVSQLLPAGASDFLFCWVRREREFLCVS
jgi:hypothetical protein